MRSLDSFCFDVRKSKGECVSLSVCVFGSVCAVESMCTRCVGLW